MTIEAGLTEYVDPHMHDMQARFTELILRRDYLVYHESVDLRTEYMMKIGYKELAVHRKMVDYRMARNRLSKLRVYVNKGMEPDTSAVKRELEEEFREYEEELKKRTDEMKALMHRMNCDSLSVEESKELRDMYTKVVKRLHPDLNPDATEEDLEFYHPAVEAYKCADLDRMRAIYWNTVDDEKVAIPETDLKKKILELEAEIERIQSTFPFDKREFLSNPEAIKERLEELDYMMKDYDEQLKLVNEAIKRLGVKI